MVEAPRDWSWVPGRAWDWSRDGAKLGVHTHEGQLVWWERPAGTGGYALEVASVQSFDAFLAAGPPVVAPDEVVAALRTLLTPAQA